MLKRIRIALAAVFFICLTLLLAGLVPGIEKYVGWMAKIQFLPAVMALSAVAISVVLLLTILFGRVYCSVICPLGVLQDVVYAVSSRRKGKKFGYSEPKTWIRYGVLAIAVLDILFGSQAAVALIAPYSAYGRIVASVVSPSACLPLLIVSLATLAIIVVLAWMGGRTWCNTICPVGTTLGFLSRFAIFRPSIDKSKCVQCGSCARKCKAACIDVQTKEIDYSRCVDCFDCMEACKPGGLKYKFAYGKKDSAPSQEQQKPADDSRRAFLAGAAMIGTAATFDAAAQKLDGGLAEVIAKKVPQRKERLVPFGALSVKNFYDHCTACQLCVQNCPNDVLRPSTDLEHFLQPVMQFEKGYCRPECTTCSQLCPSGAILPITPEEKTVLHIGHAVTDYSLCLVNTDGVGCGNCARHCPVGAITMVRTEFEGKTKRLPVVDEAKCIGCGACENLCPSRPFSAIHVEGNSVHIKE